MIIAAPVSMSPAPNTVVPWLWSHNSACTTRLSEVVAWRRARSANGRRSDGRNRPTASVRWIARRTGSDEAGMARTMLAGRLSFQLQLVADYDGADALAPPSDVEDP